MKHSNSLEGKSPSVQCIDWFFFLIQLEKHILFCLQFLCPQNGEPKLLHSEGQAKFISCCAHLMLEMGIQVMVEGLSQCI